MVSTNTRYPAQLGLAQTAYLRRAEMWFAVISISLLIGSLRSAVLGMGGGGYSLSGAAEGNSVTQAIMASVYLIAGLLLVSERAKASFLIRNNIFLLAVIAYVVCSPIWADSPSLSLRRSVGVVGNSVLGFYLVSRFSPREFLELMGWAFGLTLMLDIAAILLMPEIGTQTYRGGAFRGLHGHKNILGKMMILGALVFWSLRSRPGWRRWYARVGFLLCAALAFMSLSRGAWVVFAGLFVVVLPLLRGLMNQTLAPSLRIFWIGVFGVGGFVALAATSYVSGLELIGKDATLTDRTIIWDFAIEKGMRNPWLGAGFGSFWEGSAGRELAFNTWNALGQAHNGFLDIWLQLGFVGLALIVALLVLLGYKSLSELLYRKEELSVFAFCLVAYIVSYSFVERMIPDHRNIVWTTLVVAVLYHSVWAGQAKQGLPFREPNPGAET